MLYKLNLRSLVLVTLLTVALLVMLPKQHLTRTWSESIDGSRSQHSEPPPKPLNPADRWSSEGHPVNIPKVEGTVYDFEVPVMLVGDYVSTYKQKYARPEGEYMPEPRQLLDLAVAEEELIEKQQPSMTVFTFRSNLSSPKVDIFAVQEKALQVCDKDTAMDGCTIRLKENYGFNLLAVKLIETLKLFCVDPHKSDIYVKLDDDVIVSQSDLNRMARLLYHSPCKMAGPIALDYNFYWARGEMYMFTREILERVCSRIPDFVVTHHAEDILMGQMIGSDDESEFCYTEETPKHKLYEDSRLRVEYKDIHPEIET